jgi:hypothetical protein
MEHLQANLRRVWPNEYYEVHIEEVLPPEKENRPLRLWKFLVELPESVIEILDSKSLNHQAKAMSAAKKLVGTEIMNEAISVRFVGIDAAKLIGIDAAELDSTKSIRADECRVWVLQRPERG